MPSTSENLLDFEQRYHAPGLSSLDTGFDILTTGSRFARPTPQITGRYRQLSGPTVGDIKQVLHLWNVDPPTVMAAVDAQLERSFFAPCVWCRS